MLNKLPSWNVILAFRGAIWNLWVIWLSTTWQVLILFVNIYVQLQPWQVAFMKFNLPESKYCLQCWSCKLSFTKLLCLIGAICKGGIRNNPKGAEFCRAPNVRQSLLRPRSLLTRSQPSKLEAILRPRNTWPIPLSTCSEVVGDPLPPRRLCYAPPADARDIDRICEPPFVIDEDPWVRFRMHEHWTTGTLAKWGGER